jgi:DNA-binding CsgD family transcriptional regulator
MKNLDLTALSEREREILDLATRGLTDQQIANKLEITASTVNSYWVRIRGKLGRYSRTELVSKIIQQAADQESSTLSDRIRSLESELCNVKSSSANYANADFLALVFQANPEACALFDAKWKIIMANSRFENLFELPKGGAENVAFDGLFKTGVRGSLHIDLNSLPDRANLGLNSPLFGSKSDGSLFRAFMVVGIREEKGQTFYCCVVRPFIEELQSAQSRATLVVSELS